MAIAQNESLAGLYINDSVSYNDLSPDNKLRFSNLMSDQFWIWHGVWDDIQSCVLSTH